MPKYAEIWTEWVFNLLKDHEEQKPVYIGFLSVGMYMERTRTLTELIYSAIGA